MQVLSTPVQYTQNTRFKIEEVVFKACVINPN